MIDDDRNNLAAAAAQFPEHDVVMACGQDEGHALLTPQDSETWRAIPHGFDIVLVDLLMPAGKRTQSSESRRTFVGQEMPMGIFLALLAAYTGAKQVLLLTDTGHHDHPASAALDPFYKEKLRVQDATLVCINMNAYWWFREDDLTTEVDYSMQDQPGVVKAKRWRKIFDENFPLEEQSS